MPWSRLNSSHEPVDDALVEVVAAEVGVAVGGLHLEGAFAELQDGDVEGAAAEVVDGDRLLRLLVEAVGEGGGRGLVDDAQHLEAGDLAGVLGGLALAVVEVGGDGDDGLGDRLAQVGLGVGLQLLEDHGRDLGRRSSRLPPIVDVGVAVGGPRDLVGEQRLVALDLGVVELAAHEALDGVDGVVGVGDGLSLGDGADEALARLADGDDGRRGASALAVGDDDGLAGLDDADAAIGGAEVDSDYFRHDVLPPIRRCVRFDDALLVS